MSSSEVSTPAVAPSEERERLEEKREKVIEELKPGLAVCLRCKNDTKEDERGRMMKRKLCSQDRKEEEKEDIRGSTGSEKEGIAKRNYCLSIQ
jgi:hypothetical protein